MKMLIPAIMFYSTLSFADFKCQEKDSTLYVQELSGTQIKVKLQSKTSFKTFLGQKDETPFEAYFQTEKFNLFTPGHTAFLKISIIPVVEESNCTGRRVCGPSTIGTEITAELDFLGKVTTYDCQTVSI